MTLVCFLLISTTQLEAREISRVVIDAGHGGKDPGAGRGTIHEKQLALNVALELEKLLKAKGMPVTMTRRDDTFISLRGRADIGNKYPKAVFVSIHFNASSSNSLHGVETYYFGNQSYKLATHVHLRMLDKLKTRDGRIRKNSTFAVLHAVKCPSILVECGYLSNTQERLRCNTDYYQKACARAIAEGIWAYKTYN